MVSRYLSVPLPEVINGVHYFTSGHLGSQHSNANAVYGYSEPAKPRWQEDRFTMQDVGALERFGIDPTKPVPLGVVMQADPYGYPIDGFTNGYTTKLPPPADPVAAEKTPKSYNVLGVVAKSDGAGVVNSVPGDAPIDFDPVDAVNGWTYGENSLGTGATVRAKLSEATKKLQVLTELARQTGGTISAADLERILYGGA